MTNFKTEIEEIENKKIVVNPEERELLRGWRLPFNYSKSRFMAWLKISSAQMMNTRHFIPETNEIIYEQIDD
jgi:hypothetical protein